MPSALMDRLPVPVLRLPDIPIPCVNDAMPAGPCGPGGP